MDRRIADGARRRGKVARRAQILGVVIAISALAITACGGSKKNAADRSSGATVTATETPKKGGNVTMLVTGLPNRLDPVLVTAYGFTSGAAMNALYGNLIYTDSETNKLKMGFLKSLTASADFKTWTAVLNPGIKFHDDTPLDAAAIAFNIKRAADATLGSLFVKDAQSVTSEVVDPLTLKMTLSAPNAYFDAVFAEDFSYVGSPTAIQKSGTNFGTQPVGAGPFKFDSLDSTGILKVSRASQYASFAANQPYLDGITFQVVSDFPKQATAIQGGTAQIAIPYGGSAIDSFRSLGNTNVTFHQTSGGSGLYMSLAKAPFNDIRARQAINLALDRTAIANGFHPGTAPQTNLFAKNSPFYDSKYDYAAQDKVKAQQLFDQLAAEGKAVNFTYNVADVALQVAEANLVQSSLAAFKNVTMKIAVMPTTEYITKQRGGDYQMTPVGLYIINPIPEVPQLLGTGQSLNTMKYSNAAVDEAISKLLTISDVAKQKEQWGIIQDNMNKDLPVYWAGQGLIGWVTTKDITGVQLMNYGNAPVWGTLGYKQ